MATMYIDAGPERRSELARRQQRATVSLPALISVDGERHSAQLHNLSPHGAMIQSAVPVSMEDRVVLSCGSVERLGRVAWAEQGCFGIEFRNPIGEDEVEGQIARSDAITMRRHQRLGTVDPHVNARDHEPAAKTSSAGALSISDATGAESNRV